MRTVLALLEEEILPSDVRLATRIASFNNADWREPSQLPGWTRAHVVTHIARNADGLVNLLTWARTGIETPQYPSAEARNAGIESGAARPAAELVADLESASARFADAVRQMPERAWRATVRALQGNPHPAWYLLPRRARELEVHHADLGAGYGPADWPAAFAARELHDTVTLLGDGCGIGTIHATDTDRSWTGLGDGPEVSGDERSLLAWLSGRSDGAGVHPTSSLPATPAWMRGTAPPGLPADPPATYP